MGLFDDWVPAPTEELPPPKAAVTVRPYTPGTFSDYGAPEEVPVVEAPPRTWADTARSAGQTLYDTGRAALSSGTFGMYDRLAGVRDYLANDLSNYVHGVDTSPKLSDLVTGKKQEGVGSFIDKNVAQTEASRERSPTASIVGDVAGAFSTPVLGVGGKIAAKVGPAAVKYVGERAGGLLSRGLGYGVEGGLVGGVQGAGHTYTGNLPDYVKNATMGTILGAGTGAVTGGLFGPRPPVSGAPIPTTAEQAVAKNAAYDALRGLRGDTYDELAVGFRAGPIENELLRRGYYRAGADAKSNAPETYRAIDWLTGQHPLPGGNTTPGGLEATRQMLNNIPFKTPDRTASGIVKRSMQDFIENPPPGAVIPGPIAANNAMRAGRLTADARALAAGEKRSQTMADMRVAAENQAKATYSGMNVENNIRNQVKNFINPRTGGRERLMGYSPEEVAALNDVVSRGRLANVGRWAGNIAGGGGGVAVPFLALGGLDAVKDYTKDNPVLATLAAVATPAAGLLLRAGSNRFARANIQAAEDMINKRNPLYQQSAATAPMVPGPSALSGPNTERTRNAITQWMLMQNMGGQ